MSTNSVLIVDDDSEIHDLIRAMLKDTPWNAESSVNAEEALARLKNASYDVVLTDIMMPGMDGLTLLHHILETRPEAKVVVMTAFNRPDRVAGSLREKAAAYLSKPFSKSILVETLSSALRWQMQADDIEVLSDRPNWITVRARCKLEVAGRLTRFFHEMPTQLDTEQREMASVAFSELLMNAIEHGGKLDPEKKVELHFIRTERAITYYVRDPGEGFSLDKLQHAAISHPGDSTGHLEVREEMGIGPGGFGILLLKNFADELIYNSKGNEVILIKRL
jgi:CheY-like chemotaxis protein/anti-sigma regulatory factor (Ser/Thr protein kinase)